MKWECYFVQQWNLLVKLKFCHTCQVIRPPRSFHCRVCKSCIENLDHHCFWLSKCIGKHNYNHFIVFISTLLIGTIYFYILCITRFFSSNISHKIKEFSPDLYYPIITWPILIFLIPLSILHIRLNLRDQTTIEYLKNVR